MCIISKNSPIQTQWLMYVWVQLLIQFDSVMKIVEKKVKSRRFFTNKKKTTKLIEIKLNIYFMKEECVQIVVRIDEWPLNSMNIFGLIKFSLDSIIFNYSH